MDRKERIIKKCYELKPKLKDAGIFVDAVYYPLKDSHKVYLFEDKNAPSLSDGFCLDETVENICLSGDCTAWVKLLDEEIKKAGINL